MAKTQSDCLEKVSRKLTAKTEDITPDDYGILAAEYVLGVQDDGLRQTLSRLAETNADFAGHVDGWQMHLSALNVEYAEAKPPARVKKALDARLFGTETVKRTAFWDNIWLWRGATFASLALGAILFFQSQQAPDPLVNPESIVVAMQSDTGDVRFMAYYEAGEGKIRVARLNAEKASDRDYELWLIEEDGVPRSIGVIADEARTTVTLDAELIARIDAGDTFAVSVEPLGGSPTGEVTGPVIAAGVSGDV